MLQMGQKVKSKKKKTESGLGRLMRREGRGGEERVREKERVERERGKSGRDREIERDTQTESFCSP